MTDFDTRLRQSLEKDDAEFLKDLEDGRGLFVQMSQTFHGPMRFWTFFVGIIIFIMTGLGFYSIWHMFQAETTRGLLLWMSAAWAAWTAQVMLKQWIYDRMNTLSILRELKKIELRLIQLEKAD